MKPDPPRLLLIDPHPVVSRGVIDILNQEWPDLESLVALDFEAARGFLNDSRPSLVMSEFRIGESTVMEVLPIIQNTRPATRLLVFSSQDEIRCGIPSIRAGASGFLPKSASHEELVAACQALLGGRPWISEPLAQAMANGFNSHSPPTVRFTARESEIFNHLGQGLTCSEIAARLSLSVKTIETHRENIKTKLGLQTASQVTAAASRWMHDFSI